MSERSRTDTCDRCIDGVGRRGFLRGCGAVAALAAAGMSAETVAAQEEFVAELLDDLPDNWGRWGDDDELGALNLLGSDQVRAGLTAALRGRNVRTFTLQLPMTGDVLFKAEEELPTDETGDPVFPGRTPARRGHVQDQRSYDEGEVEPLAGGMKYSDDKFFTDFYLQGTTHVDALGHAWYGDAIYNGFDADTTAEVRQFERGLEGCPHGEVEEVTETRGHGRAGIEHAATNGIAGRGVLLDVGRHLGDENGRLPPETGITLSDLRETARAQGTQIRERDVLLIRTGSIVRTQDPEPEWHPSTEPGLAFSRDLVCWLHDMDVPILGADNLAVEKVVHEVDGQQVLIPLHGALLRNLGVYLNEILWLEDLAAQCAEDGVYEFLYAGAPLNAERSSGGPINPVVLKSTGGGS